MAMKSPSDDHPRPIRDLLRRLIKAPAALSIIWPALLVVGGYVAWHQWGADHVADKFYGVQSSLIQVTPAPDYVRTDVVKSVYDDTAMEGLSLLDPQATAKIASAFSMHPWVKRVTSVRKLPGGVIDVRVQYRRPVAMVLVQKPQGQTGEYFFPVDGQGVLLPTSEFARAETLKYIHIVVPGVYPTGLVGLPFGDSRVESAAHLAAILADYREEAGVVGIGVPGDPRLHRTPQLEVTTEVVENGERVEQKWFWGSAPGAELPGELTVAMKLRRMLDPADEGPRDLRIAGPVGGAPLVGSQGEANQAGATEATPASSRREERPGWVPEGRRVTPLK